MSRSVTSLTLDTLGDLPVRCRQCVFWELEPLARDRAAEAGDEAWEKEAWLSRVLLDWGSCGKLVYADRVPAGYVTYAPPGYVPRAVAFPTSPVGADAILLMTAYVVPEFTSGGLGRVLVQSVAADLVRRGVRAIEAFGDLAWDGPACVLPAQALLAVGFKTVRPHHRYPRLRMELRSTQTWRADIEVALERLLGSISGDRPVKALRPV